MEFGTGSALEDSILLRVMEVSKAVGNIQDDEAACAQVFLLERGEKNGSTFVIPASDGECLVVISLQSSSKSIQADSIHAQRIRIVDRVKQNKVDEIELEFRKKLSAIDEEPDPCRRDFFRKELDCWRASAECAAEDYCVLMEKPGIVMGELELQAVADLRGAPVEVNGFMHIARYCTLF
jgi:hypothetical protein